MLSVVTASPRAMIWIGRIEVAGRQRDEDVGGVVGEHGGQDARPGDAGRLQRRLGCRVALDAQIAGVARLLCLVLVLLDQHEGCGAVV